MQDFNIFGLKSFFFFYTLLKILGQSISSFISLALVIIDLKIVLRKFVGPTDLFGTPSLYVYELSKVVIVSKHKNFMLIIF